MNRFHFNCKTQQEQSLLPLVAACCGVNNRHRLTILKVNDKVYFWMNQRFKYHVNIRVLRESVKILCSGLRVKERKHFSLTGA